MPFSPLEYLRHIRDEAIYLVNHASGLSRTEFLGDETLQRAFVRSLEVIGEATKKVPEELRHKYPAVDWRAMAGMRDRLVHDYFGIDYEIVWDVVTSRMEPLLQLIEEIIANESSGSSA